MSSPRPGGSSGSVLHQWDLATGKPGQVPPGFWDTHKDATVTLEMRIGNEGSVFDPRVIASPGDDYSALALQAIKNWRFRPALCDGQPIGITLTLTMKLEHGLPRSVEQ